MQEKKNSIAREFEELIELKSFNVIEKEFSAKKAGDKDLKTPLLPKSDHNATSQRGGPQSGQDKAESQSLFAKIRTMIHGPAISTESRIIKFDGKVIPPNPFENIVRNQKYSILSFIPIVLFNQFKFFFNMFFLLISLSQFYEPLKIGYLFTYIGPLIFVLVLTMFKEAYDDFKRYKRDKEANSQLYKVLKSGNKSEMTPASALQVGHIIEVRANQRIPADLLLLHTTDESETVFIRTDQLDGETDWKLRKPVRYTQALAKNEKPLYGLRAFVTAEAPNQHIYNFEGLFQVEGGDGHKEPLSLENTLWANTVLASSTILALVMYTGKETRMAMNSKTPRTKVCQLDLELNKISKILFVFMLFLAGIMLFLRGFGHDWGIQYFKYVLLLSSIIPISLRVNLDFAKSAFSYMINADKDIEGTVARNSMIPEELGRIEYLLSDKTGTLTQNDMVFKRLVLEQYQFTDESLPDIERIIKKQCSKHIGPAKDIEERMKESSPQKLIIGGKKKKMYKRDKEMVLRDMITSLVLCHNVTPTHEDGVKMYQASSPDEIALVKIAESVQMELVERTQNHMTIKNAAGVLEHYDILANFPFSSETKRMGIVVRHKETGRIIFYLKGADTIMKYKIPEYQRGYVQDEVDELAKIGLRTLIIAQRYLTEEQFNEWFAKYNEANTVLVNREATVRKVIDQLEVDMDFLGITGVEDKLQEDVASTIETLRDAGIHVWMLTGDKVETATCIAISAGFKSRFQEFFVMRELSDPLEIQNHLVEFNKKSQAVLIIDGSTLQHALEHHEKYFFQVAGEAPAVVCCRCSPTQKALITTGIKTHLGKKTLGIGDGGNDVGMIQAADVGVGIVGKEGKQAALAADYSINKFKYVKTLLLWHGRNAYKRTAVMSQFVIHRGLIISIIQAFFSITFYNVAIQVYNGLLMLGYVTIYTMFPVFCLIFDTDVSKPVALNYSPLYKTLQKGRQLNTKTFFIWVWKSIYQGAILFLLSISWFQTSFVNIVTITFTALVLSQLLNISTEITRWNMITVVAQLATVTVYFLSILYFKNYLSVSELTWDFGAKVFVITFLSWAPLHFAKYIMFKINPARSQKIMKRVAVMEKLEKDKAKELERLEQMGHELH